MLAQVGGVLLVPEIESICELNSNISVSARNPGVDVGCVPTKAMTPLTRLSSTSALLTIPIRRDRWVSKKWSRPFGGFPSLEILCNASFVRSVALNRAPSGVILSERSRQLWSLSKLMFNASAICEPFLRMSAVKTSSDCSQKFPSAFLGCGNSRV